MVTIILVNLLLTNILDLLNKLLYIIVSLFSDFNIIFSKIKTFLLHQKLAPPGNGSTYVIKCWFIIAELQIPRVLASNMLLIRSNLLKPYVPSQQPLLKIHRYDFDTSMAEIMIRQHASNIIDECNSIIGDPDKIISILENNIIPIVKECKYTRKREAVENRCREQMQKCNTLFKSYIDSK